MNRYNSYKDCGIYYLPILPAGWKIRKAKYLFNQEKRVPRKEDEIVTCFRDGQVTLRKNRRTEGFTNSLKEIGYQGIRKGDLVIHNMDAFAGAIGVSDSDGKGTPVYTVCTPKGKDINQYFYCYFLRVLSKQGFIQSLAKGIRERSTDFRWSDFKEVYFPIPTIEEQNAIVSYIRTTTSKLDAAIAREQKMIDLLNERKQIIINHAVTKGLNPNAKLKDSGVDWIGEIPEGWETIPLRFVFEIRNGYTPSKSVKEYWEDGIIPWYRMEDIHKSGRILHDSIQHITKKAIKGGGLVDKNNGEEEGGEDTEDLIMKLIRERKMSENCSYFAFTATPKRETLERFGTLHADGDYYPYHLYSMKQAIEEGFILDVLTNYTTYHSYYEVEKSIKDNPKYNNKRAQKMLRGMVEREPHTIAEKAEIMLNHFDTKVYRSHKLNGQGKAIVATKDIECAIRYYQALQILRGKYNLPYNILIAFSGKKVVDGVEYTEESINGFKDSFTSDEFDKEENRILVVAKKYLTGFDQDKLCAMYIDKPLDGVIAVQALSRLNRAAPALGKRSEDLFVLDFYNSAESMKEAFDPYYTVTSLSGPTDVNILHDLRSTLLDAGVFEEEDIDDFAELFFHKENAETFAPILGKCALRFTNELNWDDDSKADFKMKCKQFVRVYSRMAAIMDFESADWEKTYWFLRLLIPELKMDRKDEDLKDLVKSVDLSTYGLTRTALNQKIELDAETTVVDPTKAAMVNANNDDTKDPLDQILKEFNERFFKGWKATPDEQKEKLVNIVSVSALPYFSLA